MEINPPTSELMSPVHSFPNRFFSSDFQNDEEFNAPASVYTYMHVDCSRSSEAPVRSPDVVISNNFMNSAFNDGQVMDNEEASQDSHMQLMPGAVSGSSHGPSLFAESSRDQLDGWPSNPYFVFDTPQGTRYWIPNVADKFIPVCGKSYPTFADVLSMYELYAFEAVLSFNDIHNHELVESYNRDLSKISRKLSFSTKQFIHNMSLNRIGPMRAYRCLVALKGGHHNVNGTPVDFKNFSHQLRIFIGERDAQVFLEHLRERFDNLPNFYFDYTVSNGKLSSVFWADEISKLNYKAFGDVLTFDATYSTNRYKMVFVPFTGVDHHFQCVTFGAGLISTESIESYVWLLKAFLKAHGTQPTLVLSDQDPSMLQAIPMVFTESRHRLCMWHIMKKLPSKISADVLDNTDLRSCIHRLVWNVYIKPETFESRWNDLLQTFGLQDHSWLNDMYNIKHLWVPAYFRELPMCCLMKTTSRCESSNAAFKVNSTSANTLVQFMMCFENRVDSQRYRQRVSEYKTSSTMFTGNTDLAIEQHAFPFTQTLFSRKFKRR
ncbi:protein FAR1-RELATED SEQUENCE 5-like [Helianthus annuus]|uniref:protein FAR1-RELATED SEQUENCE 5-like n=1 Tax=Helianthus annuus TaxID=4232 RepID=UPI00165333E2|nr:protein FAR1-RELATED SEQUENCE 5-like [Helianthus annuus]